MGDSQKEGFTKDRNRDIMIYHYSLAESFPLLGKTIRKGTFPLITGESIGTVDSLWRISNRQIIRSFIDLSG